MATAASERGTQLAARAAPLGPEVDEHGDLPRALDHGLLELRLGDVGNHAYEVREGTLRGVTDAAPQLVILDCDGVLVDSEVISVRVDAEVVAELGWSLTEQEVAERYLGGSYEAMVADIEANVEGPLEPGWDKAFDRRYREAFAAELQPVAGVLEALDRITLPTCVASSGSIEKMRLTLGLTGLWERFEGRIFSADDVEHAKPAPDLFLHAAAAMGVDPERAWWSRTAATASRRLSRPGWGSWGTPVG